MLSYKYANKSLEGWNDLKNYWKQKKNKTKQLLEAKESRGRILSKTNSGAF